MHACPEPHHSISETQSQRDTELTQRKGDDAQRYSPVSSSKDMVIYQTRVSSSEYPAVIKNNVYQKLSVCPVRVGGRLLIAASPDPPGRGALATLFSWPLFYPQSTLQSQNLIHTSLFHITCAYAVPTTCLHSWKTEAEIFFVSNMSLICYGPWQARNRGGAP